MKPAPPTDRGTTLASAGGTARLMFYSLLAISLMALDYRGRYVERVRALAEQAVEPVFWAVDLPSQGLEWVHEQFEARGDLAARLARLEVELVEARARAGRTADLQVQNDRLRKLLETARRARQEFIAAELASVDLDPFAHRMMVRRGSADGIRPGMPVVDDRGVLGQVETVLLGMSRVILISDPDHALPVQILPGGERTIAYGSGSLDRLRLTDLPMNAAVAPGDLVVTSGIGGRFPAGLEVARIQSVTRQPGQAFASARAVPLAGMDRNRIVLILDTAETPAIEDEAEAIEQDAPAAGPGEDGATDGDPSQAAADSTDREPPS